MWTRVATDGLVLVADLDAFPASIAGHCSRRWVEAGAGALFALPMCVGAIRVGVLALHRVLAGQLGSATMRDSLAFAEVGLGLLLDEQVGLSATAGDVAVPGGLSLYSTQVHQATGMISA